MTSVVLVFAAGKYETGSMARWAEGDWNGDLRFGTGDLVMAFEEGGYDQGPPGVSPRPPSFMGPRKRPRCE